MNLSIVKYEAIAPKRNLNRYVREILQMITATILTMYTTITELAHDLIEEAKNGYTIPYTKLHELFELQQEINKTDDYLRQHEWCLKDEDPNHHILAKAQYYHRMSLQYKYDDTLVASSITDEEARENIAAYKSNNAYIKPMLTLQWMVTRLAKACLEYRWHNFDECMKGGGPHIIMLMLKLIGKFKNKTRQQTLYKTYTMYQYVSLLCQHINTDQHDETHRRDKLNVDKRLADAIEALMESIVRSSSDVSSANCKEMTTRERFKPAMCFYGETETMLCRLMKTTNGYISDQAVKRYLGLDVA